MTYTTELMKQILTSKEAQTIIDYVSPQYGRAYVALWLFQSIGSALDRLDNFTDEYIKQVVPQTATWSIDMWEKQYGIISNPEWTIEQRQKNITNRMIYRAPMNPSKIQNLISNIYGVPVEIKENVGKNKFTVIIRGYISDLAMGKRAIDEAKPAHLIYDIYVSELAISKASVYHGIAVSEQEIINVEVI